MKIRISRGGYTYALPLSACSTYCTAEVESMLTGFLFDKVCENVYFAMDSDKVRILPGEARLAAAIAVNYHNTCVHEQWCDDQALDEELGRTTKFDDAFPPAPLPRDCNRQPVPHIVAVKTPVQTEECDAPEEAEAEAAAGNWVDVVKRKNRVRQWLGMGTRGAPHAANLSAQPTAAQEADTVSLNSWDAERDGERVVYDEEYEMNEDIIHGTQLRRDEFEWNEQKYA